MKAVMTKIQIKIYKIIKILMNQLRQKTTEPIKTKMIKHRLNPYFNKVRKILINSNT